MYLECSPQDVWINLYDLMFLLSNIQTLSVSHQDSQIPPNVIVAVLPCYHPASGPYKALYLG